MEGSKRSPTTTEIASARCKHLNKRYLIILWTLCIVSISCFRISKAMQVEQLCVWCCRVAQFQRTFSGVRYDVLHEGEAGKGTPRCLLLSCSLFSVIFLANAWSSFNSLLVVFLWDGQMKIASEAPFEKSQMTNLLLVLRVWFVTSMICYEYDLLRVFLSSYE